MTPRRAFEYGFAILIFLLVGSLLVGQVIGQPILLSYVETGSMEPQLQPGDGFVAIPLFASGPVQEGDVIVFDAENLHDGGLVTHRVVDATDSGYITKGDANPVIDQDGAEPPVTESQIKAKALQVGGSIVVIPKLGILVILINTALTGVQQRIAGTLNAPALLGSQGLSYLLFGFGIAIYVISEIAAQGSGRERKRSVSRRRRNTNQGQLIVVALSILLMVFLTMTMTVPAGTHQFDVVSSSQDAPGIRVIESGTTETVRYQVPSNGLLPVLVFLEPQDSQMQIDPTRIYVPPDSVRESIIAIEAPATNGYYKFSMTEHRYLAILPLDTIDTLYEVHPWLPIIAIDILIGLGFAAIGSALVAGSSRVRTRNLSVTDRLRRRF